MKQTETSSVPISIVMAIGGLCIMVIALVATFSSNQLQKKDLTYAACDSSYFSINAPSGYTFSPSCIAENASIYSTDSRFVFFLPGNLGNTSFIKTPNSEVKDNLNLSWSINLAKAATVYVMPRKIPGLTPPNWITSGYTKQTNDDFSQITQFFKRKNEQGLIGLYDIYSKSVNSGTVNFSGAADSQHPAYSMYVVAIASQGGATPVATPGITPPTGTPGPTGPPGEQKGYIVTNAELAQRRSRPEADAMLSYANSALNRNPSPQNPLNIPGTTGPFVDDSNAVNVLGIAYGLTGDVKYAVKAREYIMAWVNTTKSLTNACPDGGGCQTALITSRMTPGFVFAADHIKPSGVFSASDDAAFKSWLRTVMLPSASTRINNWGDAGTQMRVVVTDYIGDSGGLSSAIAKLKSQIDLVASDGHIPEETRRGTGGITYSSGAIGFRIVAAKVLERRGVDMWGYGRMKLSVDYMAKYVTNASAWPWSSGAGTAIHSWWELAYTKWRDPAYQPIVIKGRPIGVYENNVLPFSTLTNGY
jgi:hypothetical protein